MVKLLNKENWPDNGLQIISGCPLCKCNASDKLYSGLVDAVFGCAPGKWDMYQCSECRSAYLNPRPSEDSIHIAYSRYYTHESKHRLPDEKLTAWRMGVRALANGYRNWRYGSKIAPSNTLGRWILPLFPFLRSRLDSELRYLPPLKANGRLLDVGFGSGDFLLTASKLGWDVSGVDFDPICVANFKKYGFEVREGGIDAFDDADQKFDVITMSHVIEHLHNPKSALIQAYKLLKSSGELYIDTPNIDAKGHMEFRENWRGLEVPRHLVIFNWNSMINSLREAGFRNITPIIRRGIYSNLAGASRAQRNRKDPNIYHENNIVDQINELKFDLLSFFKKDSTEFITIKAKK